MRVLRFEWPPRLRPNLTAGDGLILLGIAAVLYGALRLGLHAPREVTGPDISLAPTALPWYAFLSLGRMLIAYLLSLAFSLAYGHLAATHAGARRVLIPLLDVLQSVPILSFLPAVLLGASAVLPEGIAAELSAIVLIFTSQVWNLTFSFHQSLGTVPRELEEASRTFRFGFWLRFRTVELPFAAIGLVWNSVMSWAGGWFFLMAAEMFRVGTRDFRLPGLGSYLQTAANAGDVPAVLRGVAVLVALIVVLDQVVWRPLLAWSERFKVETVQGSETPGSWLLPLLSRAWIVRQLRTRTWGALSEWLDGRDLAARAGRRPPGARSPRRWRLAPRWDQIALGLAIAAVVYGAGRAALLLSTLPPASWLEVALALLATFARVALALALALLWTVPVGVAIGTSRRLARVVQPLAQILASVPATALFPVILLAILRLPHGIDVAAVFLMLLGTQWYLLFNVIAGASAIPQDLRYTTRMLGLSGWQRWRTLILPALFPYVVTGAITASGGAWNASIVAEYVEFGGEVHSTVGVGALIARSTAGGDYALLLASTLALIVTVVLVNRTVWNRLYRVAERRFRMD